MLVMGGKGAQTAPNPESGRGRAPGVLIDGEFLAAERKKRGYSQVSFCTEFGLSRKVIKEAESNPRRRIQPQTLSAIAGALGVQPRDLTLGFSAPRLLTTPDEILKTNLKIVRAASTFLCTTGSRSRDNEYLDAIEQSVTKNPSLAYFRILFGTPMTPQMVRHLRRIIDIRNSNEESRQTISIGIYASVRTYPSEATICLNERMALFVLPSIHGAWRYDTAVVFEEPAVIEGWHRWIEEMYRAGNPIGTPADIARLEREYK
jgi:transcriptional regulator with XRE-family HTH domain